MNYHDMVVELEKMYFERIKYLCVVSEEYVDKRDWESLQTVTTIMVMMANMFNEC